MQDSPARLLWLLLCLAVPLGTTGAEVSGVLRDNQGNGLTGITVNASYFGIEEFTLPVAITDAAGHFSFAGGPGWWSIEVPASELNARGYFSVPGSFLMVTGQWSLRFTTRKLDFTHRMKGRVIDEAGQPLAGYSLRAHISENDAQFETNAVTDANGSFMIAAVPAVWSFSSPLGLSPENVFGERSVEVEVTNAEKQVTFVAPAATSTIAVTLNNISDWDVVASAEAFGATYRLIQSVSLGAENNFRVFDGVWTISATNANRFVSEQNRPVPLTVTVTNNVVSVVLTNAATSSPTQQVQRVRTITTSGMVVSNASVYANSAALPFRIAPPPQPFGTPGVFDLRLANGRWRLSAVTGDWRVSREVTIFSNVFPPEITLVFPESNAGAEISGTVRTPDGPGVALHSVSLRMMDGATNSGASVLTDSLGHFAVHVQPGQWQLQTYNGSCPLSSVVVVSNQDVQADFEVSLPSPARGAPVLLNLTVNDEGGPPDMDLELYLQSGVDYILTNTSPGLELSVPSGLWHGWLLRSSDIVSADYMLFPSFTWQLSPGAGTNLLLIARQASTRIEGRLRDEQGRLLLSGYAGAWTSVNGIDFWTYGTIASGYFSLNVFPGEWQVGASLSNYPRVGVAGNSVLTGGSDPSTSTSPPTHYYTTPPPRWVRVSNEVARCDFVTTNVPIQTSVTLAVALFREDGGELSGVDISAYSPAGGQTGFTDENGAASISVPPGRLTISARLDYNKFTYEPLLWPTLALDISAPSNHISLVVRRPTSCITGTISNASLVGIQASVVANAELNGTNYITTGCWDVGSHYCAPAIPGLWTVQRDGYAGGLNDYGLQSATPRNVIVPETGQAPPVDFLLKPFVNDFREARLMNPVVLPNGALQLELRGQASLSWRVERSNNLIDWTPFALEVTLNRSFIIEEPYAASEPATFYRAVWVR